MVLNGFYSNYSIIECGVPQGSVHHPLFFLVYINDLERNIKSNVKFFDDTMLFSIVKYPIKSANCLHHDLDMIYQWAHQWKMEFNPDPTKQAAEVIFSCKKVSPDHPHLIFNGTAVAKVKEQKHFLSSSQVYLLKNILTKISVRLRRLLESSNTSRHL